MKKVGLICIAGMVMASLVLIVPMPLWAKEQTSCPVMGGAINKNIYVDHNGKRVYFCCKGCPETFRKEPDKYIKQMEAEGVVLEKAPAAAEKKH